MIYQRFYAVRNLILQKQNYLKDFVAEFMKNV